MSSDERKTEATTQGGTTRNATERTCWTARNAPRSPGRFKQFFKAKEERQMARRKMRSWKSDNGDTDERAGMVILDRKDGKEYILLVKGREAGLLGLPKGHIKYGETRQQGALRECHRETNLTCLIHPDDDGIRIGGATYFVAIHNLQTMGEVKIQDTKEIMDTEWMDTNELTKMSEQENVRSIANHDLRALMRPDNIRKVRARGDDLVKESL